MTHYPDSLQAGGVAVITGGASGIGLATASALSRHGMNIVLADRNKEALDEAAETSVRPLNPGGGEAVITAAVDVTDAGQVQGLRELAFERFGEVNFLMNNAGIAVHAGTWTDPDAWRQILEVNLWGVINGIQAFAQPMLDQGKPGMIVNTGSKQGITCPPGNAAYNTSKAAVKATTESLAHSLRSVEGSQVSAHLLVPGFVYTGMISAFLPEKPPGAWTPEETVDYMLSRLAQGDFYIICPDNETTEAMDRKRVAWGAGDIIENRPALSRWHPDYAEAFATHMEE